MRIKFEKDELNNIFLKLSQEITLKQLCERCDINRNTLKRWKNGAYSIPLHIFEKFSLIVSEFTQIKSKGVLLADNWGAKKAGSAFANKHKNKLGDMLKYARSKRKFILREIPVSLENSLSALELYGVLMGDGCLCKYYAKSDKRYRYALYITGNLYKDKYYLLSYIKPLIEETFGIRCRVRYIPRDSSLHLIVLNRSLFNWFASNTFPVGRKGTALKIPDHIISLENSKLNLLIRGIFDTDGCISARKDEEYKYPYLIITSISESLREQIKQILRRQDIRAYIHKKDVIVRGNTNFEKWFKLIGSKNPRNLNKYHEWLITGRIYCGRIYQPGR